MIPRSKFINYSSNLNSLALERRERPCLTGLLGVWLHVVILVILLLHVRLLVIFWKRGVCIRQLDLVAVPCIYAHTVVSDCLELLKGLERNVPRNQVVTQQDQLQHLQGSLKRRFQRQKKHVVVLVNGCEYKHSLNHFVNAANHVELNRKKAHWAPPAVEQCQEHQLVNAFHKLASKQVDYGYY